MIGLENLIHLRSNIAIYERRVPIDNSMLPEMKVEIEKELEEWELGFSNK